MIRKAPISMIMTEKVITLKKTDSLEAAEYLFKKYKIRHIPVVNDDVIIGMLSYTDLLRLSFADITNSEVDNSADAIAIAKTNAECLSVNNINFIKSDWFQGLTRRKFDLIISNPPYIALNDPHLNQQDLRFEPKLALVAGQDGMVCIQTIISSATSYLNAGGWLLLEHGYNQASITKQSLKEAGFISIFSRSDLAGIPRVSGGRYDPPL